MDNGASSYLRFLDGDDNAFVSIIKDYKDGLILYLDSFTHNIYIAEELMEDTFVKIVTKKPAYHRSATFKTWLYAIAGNVAKDWLRKNRQKVMVSIDDIPGDLIAEDDLERQYLQEERRITLRRALRRIKSDYAQVLYLVYFESFSNEQAARVMRKSKRQIENLLYRAKHALKSELDKEGFTYEELQ